MDSRLVLALDGSTGVCSVALLAMRPGPSGSQRPSWEVVDSRAEGDGRAQAKVLWSLTDLMLSRLGLGAEALSAVVVGTGPGTFTGIRITVATARALGLSLHIPVLGVSTLAALAAAVAESRSDAEVIAPVIDARRKQVFYGLYRRPADEGGAGAGGGADARGGRWRRVEPYAVCDREALAPTVAERVAAGRSAPSPSPVTVLVGESGLAPERLHEGQEYLGLDMRAAWLLKGQSVLMEPGDLPEGDRLDGFLAATEGLGVAAAPGDPGTPESVRPIYVRSPDADIHITKMRDPWASQTDKP